MNCFTVSSLILPVETVFEAKRIFKKAEKCPKSFNMLYNKVSDIYYVLFYVENLYSYSVVIGYRYTSILCIANLRVEMKFLQQFLSRCNSGTARWKNFIPGSYCRATQELQNGA